MNFRKTEKTADIIDSIINSENGKVQKYLLERKRKEKEFLEKKENIKKKSLMAPKLNQMFVINKSEDDKLISETIGLRTVYEYKKIKDKIYNKEGYKDNSNNFDDNNYRTKKSYNLSFCTDDEDQDEDNEDDEYKKEIEEKTEKEKEKTKKEEKENKIEVNENIKEIQVIKEKDEKFNFENKESQEKDNKNYLEKNKNNSKNDIITKNHPNNNGLKSEITKFPKKIMKDPTVNTSFLKDKERDQKIQLRKKELRELYLKLENEQKEKMIEITYSYYDGSGHRRKISVKQKTTIGQFINKCVENLKNEFIQLRCASCETLIFVKEDIILPNYLTFYELIKNKAKGKTGPLFNFDAVEDLSGITDIRKERTDTHAGKIVEKKWYEKNKHIFPASKWELYKPLKNYSTSYMDLFNNCT